MNRVEKADAQPEKSNAPQEQGTTAVQPKMHPHKQGCHLFGVSLLFVALTVLTLFVILVNISVPFARACGGTPAVGGFGKAVMFSPSMRAAVKNGAVQDIDSIQTENGVTLHLWYLIADGKRLSIYYSVKGLPQTGWVIRPEVRINENDSLLPVNDISSANGTQGDGLRVITLDFGKAKIPNNLFLSLTVSDGDVTRAKPQESNYAGFTFPIEFDPSPATK